MLVDLILVDLGMMQLWRFCSREEHRLNLGFIKIESKDGRKIAYATDGHRAARYTLAQPTSAEAPPVYIGKEAVKAAVSRAKRGATFTVTQDAIERDDGMRIPNGPAPENFPDVEQLISRVYPGEDVGSIVYLDPLYLAGPIEWLKASKLGTRPKESPGVAIMIQDPYSPVRMDVEGEDWNFTYVVMPRRPKDGEK